MIIQNCILFNSKNAPAGTTVEMLYDAMKCAYPKFYKMDKLCKWAWVAAEGMFAGNGLYDGMDKNKIALVLSTSHGCIDVDKRYQHTIAMPSPALFVYTLPNIMLGEICIRHGFKGEQLCSVSEQFDAEEMYFSVKGLLDRGIEACLCGWVDVTDDSFDVCLYWVTTGGKGPKFEPASLLNIYDGLSIFPVWSPQ
jgi:hypothetical protein